MVLTLGLATWLIGALIVLFLLVSVLMVLVVLVQKPQGGGLAGAFGGNAAASGQTAFGAKTGDALTVMTIGIFVAYLLGAILLNWASRPDTNPPTTPIVTTPGEVPAQPETTPSAPGTAPASTDTPTPPTETPAAVPPASPEAPAPEAPAPVAPATEPRR